MDLFGTAGIRGSVETEVTPELAVKVGRAVGRQARDTDASECVVGRDGRTTGTGLASAMEAGLESAGVDVVRVGVVPTPTLAYASQGRLGVMLTASHNPPTDNGIKLFADGVEYDRAAEQAIEDAVADGVEPEPWDEWGTGRREPILSSYRSRVAEYAGRHGAPLSGERIAVDCGNGVASTATPQVLTELGATVISLNANVDGHFPGRESKPTPDSLTHLREFVADGEFALGIGHDGDADRIVVVDPSGEVVHEDTVLAVLAEHYVRVSDADDPVVVTTPNASARIDERVREAGGRTERVRLGGLHEGIASARGGGGDVVFAAEPWKHIHPELGGWIDGVASAAVLARLVASGGLAELRAPVTERPYRKVSIECPDAAKADAMARLETALPETFPDADVDTKYGIRLELPDGSWTLVRPSGTESYVRVYAESDEVDELVERVRETVRTAIESSSP